MIIDGLLEIIAPDRCIACDAVVSRGRYSLCDDCFGEITLSGERCRRCSGPLVGEKCPLCEERAFYPSTNYAVAEYSGVMKTIIAHYKFLRVRRLYRRLAVLAERGAGPSYFQRDIISAVPLDRKSMWRRGYNQSELVARALARRFNVTYGNVLKRCNVSGKQKTLGSRERYFNILGAFRVKNARLFRGKSILLVDDIFTTGATINECARVLIEAGAGEVASLTLARAVESIITK